MVGQVPTTAELLDLSCTHLGRPCSPTKKARNEKAMIMMHAQGQALVRHSWRNKPSLARQ